MGLRGTLVGAVAVLAITSAANADSVRHGWYFGLEGGFSSVQDTALPSSGYNSLAFGEGLALFGTVGYAFDNRLRWEGEIGYRSNDLERFNNIAAVSGNLTEFTGFMNLRYDLLQGQRWRLDIGAGVGVDGVRFENHLGADREDKVFAAQGIAGLTYMLTQHWDMHLTYRYLWADSAQLLSPTFGNGPFPVGQNDMDITKHALTIGLRYGYDDPPPPPAEPPPVVVAPPPPKQFIIFFGFNKCNITAEADAVLSEAASAAKSSGSAAVRVVGHTDSSGSNAYNQKLSECRANAAKANLVGKGISEGSISTSGKGESELMVQTGDGVKEPQNRRATVDLQ